MAVRKPLRAVAADEKPTPPVKPLTLAEAIDTGDYLQILLAQRRDIVSSLPDEKGPAKAALHRQLSLISKEIEGLELAEDEDHSVVVNADDQPWDGTGY